jgi:RNA-binding protein
MATEKKVVKQITLKGKQKKYLRGLGHHLEPVVFVGREGLSDNLFQSVQDALKTRELIKIKLGQNCAVPKKEAASQLAETSGAALVQLIGKTILLYQPNKDLKADLRISLPK